MLFKSLKGLKSFESEGHFQQLFTPVCPLPSGLGVVLCWSLHLGSILDQPCSCRRLDPEVKWGIPPTSVCAGPDLQGEPGVHVVPVSSENRNIWERREWLTGSVQQEESLTVPSGQRDPLYYVLEQMHIKSSSKQQEVGTRAVLYGLSLFLPMGMPPKESEGKDFLIQRKWGRMLWKNTS